MSSHKLRLQLRGGTAGHVMHHGRGLRGAAAAGRVHCSSVVAPLGLECARGGAGRHESSRIRTEPGPGAATRSRRRCQLNLARHHIVLLGARQSVPGPLGRRYRMGRGSLDSVSLLSLHDTHRSCFTPICRATTWRVSTLPSRRRGYPRCRHSWRRRRWWAPRPHRTH